MALRGSYIFLFYSFFFSTFFSCARPYSFYPPFSALSTGFDYNSAIFDEFY